MVFGFFGGVQAFCSKRSFTEIDTVLKKFARVYGGQKASVVSRACGRVELIGGHTDYNEGFVIAAAIDKCCRVWAGLRDDRAISMYSEWADAKHQFELSESLEPIDDCRWANYGRGVAALLLKEGLQLRGANLYIASEVPLGAGLSSSAALEVSVAKAMVGISQPEVEIDPIELARICQKAENDYADSPCGIMDQITSITGKKDEVMFLDCRDLSVKYLPFDSEHCCIMIFNSMVKHQVGGGEYGNRRRQCEQACAVLNNKYPQVEALRDADESMLESVKGQMDSVLFRRARHVIDENNRVRAAAEALSRNTIAEFGRLMNESHRSARDLYQISCEQTDFLAEQICACEGVYGARLSGGGFGGSVVALVEPSEAERVAAKVGNAYKDRFGLESQIYTVKPSLGTEVVVLR